jgi:hypothetical protein
MAIVGTQPKRSAIVGGARLLAAVLRIDAYERRNDHAMANALWRETLRTHGAMTASSIATHFALAPATRRRSRGLALATLAAAAALASAVGWALSHG